MQLRYYHHHQYIWKSVQQDKYHPADVRVSCNLPRFIMLHFGHIPHPLL